MSKHSVPADEVSGLLSRFAELRRKAVARTGRDFPIIVIQKAGLDGFWIHRVLQSEGIESHVVDAASIRPGERRGGGRESFDIVQYLPCVARPDAAEAREIAKEAVGAMLIALWPTGNDWPEQRETIIRLSGIARSEMVGALDRLRRGERAGRVLDDRFISGFALADTAEQVIAQAAQYRRAGAAELALSFAGPQPAADAAYFARAVKRLIPDG